MSYYNRGNRQKFIFRNEFSGAKIIIDTAEGAERLMQAMAGWRPAES